MSSSLETLFTPKQIKEMYTFLKLNEHVLEDYRSLEFEMMDRFEYLNEDTTKIVIDSYLSEN